MAMVEAGERNKSAVKEKDVAPDLIPSFEPGSARWRAGVILGAFFGTAVAAAALGLSVLEVDMQHFQTAGNANRMRDIWIEAVAVVPTLAFIGAWMGALSTKYRDPII